MPAKPNFLIGLKHWPMFIPENIGKLLYRNQPWYLNHQPIAFHQCRCGVPIIVLTPDLPELKLPLDKGGHTIQTNAEEQALQMLSPYLFALTEDISQLRK